MRAKHLTPDEIEALVRGEETEADVHHHLKGCAPCRETAREGMFATRYIRPLASDHPDEHVLTALWSNELSSARKAQVVGHVATCSRCGVLLERLMRATPPETSPSEVDLRQLAERVGVDFKQLDPLAAALGQARPPPSAVRRGQNRQDQKGDATASVGGSSRHGGA